MAQHLIKVRLRKRFSHGERILNQFSGRKIVNSCGRGIICLVLQDVEHTRAPSFRSIQFTTQTFKQFSIQFQY